MSTPPPPAPTAPPPMPPPPQPSGPALSEPQRLGNVFIAPSKTMADIQRNASWWAPFVVILVFSLLYIFMLGQKIGWEQIVQNEIQKNPKAMEQIDKMPPEQRERMLDLQVTITKYVSYASPVIALIIYAIVALVLMGVFNFGFGAQLKFMQCMAITVYSALVNVVSVLLGVVTFFAGVDPQGFNIRNPVATNPAYFMDATQHKFLYGVVSAFDIIVIWYIFVMSIGISRNSKVKTGAAFATIFGLYFLFKLAAAALTAATS